MRRRTFRVQSQQPLSNGLRIHWFHDLFRERVRSATLEPRACVSSRFRHNQRVGIVNITRDASSVLSENVSAELLAQEGSAHT